MTAETVFHAVAINVGANTNEPGVRGPIYPDGSFEFVPIPESEPTSEPAPTYADLDLRIDLPDDVRDLPVHLDPEFAGYPRCERYTYGDPWGVKARPLLELSAGDRVCFYASLAPRDADGGRAPAACAHPEWVVPEWGAYLIGEFRLASDPIAGAEYDALPPARRRPFANNAHVRRREFDAAVLLRGDARSRLYDRPIPLSEGPGTAAGPLVTDHSGDSGRGPWWRRPLRFDGSGARALAAAVDRHRPP